MSNQQKSRSLIDDSFPFHMVTANLEPLDSIWIYRRVPCVVWINLGTVSVFPKRRETKSSVIPKTVSKEPNFVPQKF